MLTKVKRISSKFFASLCAATLLLGILVLSTSAQEPTESVLEVNPYGYGYEPLTYPYLRRIPASVSTSKGTISCSVPRTEFIGDEQDNYLHNLAWFTVVFEGQNDNGDIDVFTASTPFADCYYLAYGNYFRVQDEYSRFVQKTTTNGNVSFSIQYDNGYLPYPDSIVEAYVYIGVNPLRYGYDSNTSGGNTDEAYQNGYSDGYENGYSNGYDTASSEIENQNALGLFGRGILDGILDIYFDTFRIPIFGTSLGEILGYFFFFVFVLVVVKIVSFVI